MMKDKRPGFQFLICPDVQMIQDQISRQADSYPPAQGEYEVCTFWGDEPPSDKFWEALSLTALLGTERLIVVRRANQWDKDHWLTLEKALSRPLSSSFPLFCLEMGWEKGAPKLNAWFAKLKCYQFAGKQNWIWRNPGLTDQNIRRYVATELKKRKLTIHPDALNTLCEQIPRSADVVKNELDKLVLLIGAEGIVTSEHLGTADWAPGYKIFSFATALLNGNEKTAWKEYSRISDINSDAFSLLGALAKNLRISWQLACGETPSGVRPFAIQKMAPLAKKLGRANIAKAISLVVDAETGIKTGAFTPSQSMENMINSLLMLTHRPR